MSVIIIIALAAAFIFYIGIGLFLGVRAKSVADILPLSPQKMAEVKSSGEFSASTVATSISLATVVLAFFELADSFGLWLFWSVITTALGLLSVRLFAKRIWARITTYEYRPTLNDFLGREYNSKSVRTVSAICTSLGFLSAFALELIVGSVFFASLVPNMSTLTMLIVLALITFIYIAIGGFRAVIVTEKIQMQSIWLFLILLAGFYAYYIFSHRSSGVLSNPPPGTLNLSNRAGLYSFLAGIFVMNVPTFLSDIGIWQRIGGSQKENIVLKGLMRSTISASVSWSLIILLACFAFVLTRDSKISSPYPLVMVINTIENDRSFFAMLVLFFVTAGLYGAMLSTASTLIIAASHTLYEDVFSRIRGSSLQQRLKSKNEMFIPRIILLISIVISIALIYTLWHKGFRIADFVFTIYGAQVGLCPLVIAALILKRERLEALSGWAIAAVTAGFLTGWTSAIYGNFNQNESFIYSSPVSSLAISSAILFAGLLYSRKERLPAAPWVLIKAVCMARKRGLLHLRRADKPVNFACLTSKCALCCRLLGSPVVSEEEAKTINPDSVLINKYGMFIKSNDCICSVLTGNLCTIYPFRPRGCMEYPWYNINGKLYYDAGCPGITINGDNRPDVSEIEPFENFFPKTPKLIIWIIKRICLR